MERDPDISFGDDTNVVWSLNTGLLSQKIDDNNLENKNDNQNNDKRYVNYNQTSLDDSLIYVPNKTSSDVGKFLKICNDNNFNNDINFIDDEIIHMTQAFSNDITLDHLDTDSKEDKKHRNNSIYHDTTKNTKMFNNSKSFYKKDVNLNLDNDSILSDISNTNKLNSVNEEQFFKSAKEMLAKNKYSLNKDKRLITKTKSLNDVKFKSKIKNRSYDDVIKLDNNTRPKRAFLEIEDCIPVSNNSVVDTDSSNTINISKGFDYLNSIKYVVLSISSKPISREKILCVFSNHKYEERIVILRDSWFETDLSIGTFVNVLGEFENNQIILDDSNSNLLICNPDILISATSIAKYPECKRKSVLAELVSGVRSYYEPVVLGSLIHCLIQCCLDKNQFDEDFLSLNSNILIKASLEDIWAADITENKAYTALMDSGRMLRSWANQYFKIGSSKSEDGILTPVHLKGSKDLICISEALDVEENIWSPKYGLKGMIDMTVEVVLKNENNQDEILVAPLEIKTGKPNVFHRAQTALYTLLVSDRYDVKVKLGLLYNIKGGNTTTIIPHYDKEIKNLIINRNDLAIQLTKKPNLPPLSNRGFTCKYCELKSSCLLYYKTYENGTRDKCEIQEDYDKIISDISGIHMKFFLKWDDLITKEGSQMDYYRTQVWNVTPDEREKYGECFNHMVITEYPSQKDDYKMTITSFEYSFAKVNSSKFNEEKNEYEYVNVDLEKTRLTIGDLIVISSLDGKVALAKGYIKSLHQYCISILVDRRWIEIPEIKSEFDSNNKQRFYSKHTTRNLTKRVIKPQLFRIDKDDMGSGIGILRNNLISMLCDNDSKCRKLRNSVVDLKKPKFIDILSTITSENTNNLNSHQINAVNKILSAEDYALLLGMPGTGKTTTIVQLLKILYQQGKRVLLTSYTHSAVDNVLLRLKKLKVPFLRLGVTQKIHEDILEYTSEFRCSTVEELDKLYSTEQIIATTCLGIRHPLFQKTKFDYCIVDEASQLTLPACVGPLRFADKFLLVGDHYQLPPLVKSEDAMAGLSTSLFKLLSEKHPEAVISLKHQYRMNKDIMTVANALIYNWNLQCGSYLIADKEINLPSYPGGIDKTTQKLIEINREKLENIKDNNDVGVKLINKNRDNIYEKVLINASQTWIREILNPRRKVVFVDLDDLYTNTVLYKNNNIIEATYTILASKCLIECGLDESELGIITPYRGQIKFLTNNLLNEYPNITISTIDKFQGSDKECIILSLVRSDINIGQLLLDWRRANVAFTRAKTKLIVFGNSSTLIHNGIWDSFLKLIQINNWSVKIKNNQWIQPKFILNDDI